MERTTDVTIYSYAEWHHNVPCSTEGEGKPPDGLRSELHKTTCAYTHTGTITYRCIDKYYQVVKVELDDWGGKDELYAEILRAWRADQNNPHRQQLERAREEPSGDPT